MSSTLTDYLRSRKKKIPRPKQETEKKGGFTMRPLKLLARNVAIKRGGIPASTREVTKAVVEDMKFAFRHGWNVTVVVVGGPGEGKSRAVFLLSSIWIAMTGGERKITWNISEIPELNDGDWLHIDEWLYLRGSGSRLALDALKNLFPLGRAKQICISVSTHVAPGLPFVTFEATTLAQDFENRRNLFEIRVPLPSHGLVYVGNAIFPLGKEDEDWAEYEIESYKRKTNVFMDSGETRVTFKLDNLELAKEVIKWATDKELIISTRGHAAAALDTMAEERGLKTNYSIDENVSNLIVMLIRSRTERESYKGQTIDLKKALYTRLEERDVKKEHVKWLRYYIEGNSQTDVAEKFKIDQSMVSRAIGEKSDLRLNNLGYAFEDVWAARLLAEGKIIVKGGENTPEPDILIKDDSGNVVEVQSVKCYLVKKSTVSINIDRIAKSELKLLDEGIPLKLVFYNIKWDKIFFADVNREKIVYKFTEK